MANKTGNTGDDGARQEPLAIIEPIDIQEEMERSFLEYSMSVIVSRALPDVRDGLKPVHRRILYGMHTGGLRPDRPHRKCGRVVGDVMGQYHPHGDQAIYDALARMTQPFSLRYPLIDGHGNFGSPDPNDRPAAMRYCVLEGSRVRTPTGTPRIETLAGDVPEPNSTTDVDAKVFDHRGNVVLASKLFHSGSRPTLRVRTREGYELTGTHNHPVLCLVEVDGVPRIEWRLLSEVRPGTRVVLDRRPDLGAPEDLTDDERSSAVNRARACAAGGATAAIPDEIWNVPTAVKQVFLQTLLENGGAGSPTGSPDADRIDFVFRSEQLAGDVHRLLLEFGVVASRCLDADGSARRLVIESRYEIDRLAVNVGLGDLDGRRLAERPGADPVGVLPDDPNWYYAEVEAVENGGVRPVYSIRVDTDDHAFVSDGFVSHNTECRLDDLAMMMLQSIDEDTVDFADTYDGENSEPVVLPARFPNLLVNGGGGIAVGMATNIPPHNLSEVIDATQHLIDHPDATVQDLMKFVQGPDFPTGGRILGRQGILDAYTTGRGSVKMRAVAEIEEGARGSMRVVISEVPYQTSVEQIGQKIEELVAERKIDGIRDIRNESSGVTQRLVVELKRDANPQVVLNNLFKQTPMQSNFACLMLALVDGVPKVLNLREILQAYVAHQVEVITRRSEYRLQKAKDRLHIVEGLLKALDMIDQVIEVIRGSDDADGARQALMAEPFDFSEIQANHILDMPLRRLTGLERQKLVDESEELNATIQELEAILGDDKKLRQVIKDELGEVKEKFGDERRTPLEHDPGEIDVLDLIEDEEVVVVLSENGYVKSVKADAFRAQGRGGRGVSGAKLRDDDYVAHLLTTSAHSYLLFFSNIGKVYRLRAHEIPMKDRTARGTALVNLVQMTQDEKIQAVIDTREYEDGANLFFATRQGKVKKTKMAEYDSSYARSGIIAIKLNDGDELVKVVQTHGSDEVFMVSEQGMTIRFSEEEVRTMGRSAAGVQGMKMKKGDAVVSCDVARDDTDILVITSSGHGKRTKLERFNAQHRGGQGVRGMKVTEKRGKVVAAFMVGLDDEIIVFSSAGNVIRMQAREISSQGRTATGVRVARVGQDDTVVAVAPVLDHDAE